MTQRVRYNYFSNFPRHRTPKTSFLLILILGAGPIEKWALLERSRGTVGGPGIELKQDLSHRPTVDELDHELMGTSTRPKVFAINCADEII